jgi:hypothetical protein
MTRLRVRRRAFWRSAFSAACVLGKVFPPNLFVDYSTVIFNAADNTTLS